MLTPILNLARAGSTSAAWTAFVAAGFDAIADDPKVLALKGRLLKDQARKVEEGARSQLFLQSAQAYADAAALRPDSYPLINAATMSLFGGQADDVASLAQETLVLLDTSNGAGETPYWHEATRAEALLLLGQRAEAEAALREARAHAPKAWEDLATTLRQFRAILTHRDEPHDWLSSYAPPKSIYFKGMMGISADDRDAADAIEALVAESGARFAFGALAAGADIMIAEAILRAGGDLHVILPIMPDAFKALSVEPFGQDWLHRFDALFAQAASVAIVDNSDRMSSAAIQLAAAVAKGRAIDNAARLESVAVPIEVIDNDGLENKSAGVLTLSRSATPNRAVDIEDRKTSILLATNEAVARRNTYFDHHGGTAIAVIDMPERVLEIIRELRGANADATIAVHAIITDGGARDNTDVIRLERLVEAAVAGTIIATASAAMALKATEPDLEIEPLGELPDPAGALNIYALGISV